MVHHLADQKVQSLVAAKRGRQSAVPTTMIPRKTTISTQNIRIGKPAHFLLDIFFLASGGRYTAALTPVMRTDDDWASRTPRTAPATPSMTSVMSGDPNGTKISATARPRNDCGETGDRARRAAGACSAQLRLARPSAGATPAGTQEKPASARAARKTGLMKKRWIVGCEREQRKMGNPRPQNLELQPKVGRIQELSDQDENPAADCDEQEPPL